MLLRVDSSVLAGDATTHQNESSPLRATQPSPAAGSTSPGADQRGTQQARLAGVSGRAATMGTAIRPMCACAPPSQDLAQGTTTEILFVDLRRCTDVTPLLTRSQHTAAGLDTAFSWIASRKDVKDLSYKWLAFKQLPAVLPACERMAEVFACRDRQATRRAVRRAATAQASPSGSTCSSACPT